MSALPPELEAAVAARLHYYRDLGVFSLYRRCDPDPELQLYRLTHTNIESEPPIPPRTSTPEALFTAPVPATLPAADRLAALDAIRADIGDCTRCPLASQGRHTIVFADGDPNARLMFVGEGPGADEDLQGLPFVGKAGQLLNNMITAMGLQRSDVYIANVVKCRPPQ